jgi:cell wall assembly regulator SMI1
MEYWLPEHTIIMPSEVDDLGGKVIKCKALTPPDKIYDMPPGVYLINAWIPHRAFGYGQRYALSLRETKDNSSWEEVVNKFSSLVL